jgi:hypothetical protein
MYQELSRDSRTQIPSGVFLTRYGADLRVAGFVLTSLGVVDFLWTRYARITFVGWAPLAFFLALLATVSVVYGYSRRSIRLSDAGIYAMLWVAFSAVGAIFTYAAATMQMPLHDVELTQIDAILGFDWMRWAKFVAAHGILHRVLAIAYGAMLPQIVGSIVYLAHTEQQDRNRELLYMSMLALVVTTLISGMVPALGPNFHFHRIRHDYSEVLLELRSGTVSTFALGDMKGIIALPSFHTVMALLFIYVHRPPSGSFLPAAILNAIMLLSLPSQGDHYLSDVVAGFGVAALSITIVRAVMRRWQAKIVWVT